MLGTISRMPMKDGKPRDFAFITCENEKRYFLHISEFRNDWHKLCNAITNGKVVSIEFEPDELHVKGPRAREAKLIV